MSTRAMFTFAKENETHNVYKHSDGYPTGAAEALVAALALAWESPRFEPDDFAAAFVAANKTKGGGIRLMASESDWRKAAPLDIAYRYDVRQAPNGQILVYAYSVGCQLIESRNRKSARYQWMECKLWSGRVKDFPAHAETAEELAGSESAEYVPAEVFTYHG